MSNKAVAVYAQAIKRQQQEDQLQSPSTVTSKATQETAQPREISREVSRENSRVQSRTHVARASRKSTRAKSRDLPTRDEIQEFSFRLRDDVKVKVQAEVPHAWQKELQEIARDLDVKKLELYRFIIGEFLEKVQRKRSA